MRTALSVAFAILATTSASGEGRDVAGWPSPLFPTIQRAVDSLRDGGRLEIAEGTFDIEGPVVIRNKWISITGRGCADLPRRDDTNLRSTRLVGPAPASRVPADSVRGLFTFVNAGGEIRGLEIVGFDAGIVGSDGDTPRELRDSRGLKVERVCISGTGRGIAWSKTGSLDVENVFIHDVNWNGVSVYPLLQNGINLSSVKLTNVHVSSPSNFCVVFKNTIATIEGGSFEQCGVGGFFLGGGMGFVDSAVSVKNVVVFQSFGPGIVAQGGATLIDKSFVKEASKAGVWLNEPIFARVQKSAINTTKPSPLDGKYGDAVVAYLRGPYNGEVQLDTVQIEDPARAGIGVFGGLATLEKVKIFCAGFDINPEIENGQSPQLTDAGGNLCGCPSASGSCLAYGSGLEPPTLIEISE